MTFSIVLLALTIYGSNVKNRKKIYIADFFLTPFFSYGLLVVIFAIFCHIVNLDLFITRDLKKLESWDRSHSKGLKLLFLNLIQLFKID